MRKRDENKENLVKEKALEMLVEEGFDGFSMQKLAKSANVSPATLYIYYKDKEDLIMQLGIGESQKMTTAILQNFSSEMSFAEGLQLQWENRAKYVLGNSVAARFFEQIKNSPYHSKIKDSIINEFSEKMGVFLRKAVENKELSPMSPEVFWSVAFAPLYNLLRFHQEGKNMAGVEFKFTQDYMYQTLQLVLKALKP